MCNTGCVTTVTKRGVVEKGTVCRKRGIIMWLFVRICEQKKYFHFCEVEMSFLFIFVPSKKRLT